MELDSNRETHVRLRCNSSVDIFPLTLKRLLMLQTGQSARQSNVGNPRCPCIGYPLDVMDELAAGDLRGSDLVLCVCCHGRMLIRVVEGVPEQHNVRCLQSPESLETVKIKASRVYSTINSRVSDRIHEVPQRTMLCCPVQLPGAPSYRL